MKCKKFQKEIERYLDGGMESADKALFERHLAGCSICADLLKEARQEAALFKEALSGLRLRESLKGKVLYRLHYFPAPRREYIAGELKRWQVFVLSASAVALFAFAFCASVWWTSESERWSEKPLAGQRVSQQEARPALVNVCWKVQVEPYSYYLGAGSPSEAPSGG